MVQVERIPASLNMSYLETSKGLLYLGLAIMEIVLVN